MKKFLPFFAFCLLNSAVFAQVGGDYAYTIGVKGYGLMQMPKILNETNSSDYTNVYFNSVMVKFNDNQISYRLKGSYYKKNITFNNVCAGCEIASGSARDYSFTVGFEKATNYAKFQPYFGTELGYRASSFTGEIRNANNSSMVSPYNVDTDKTGLLISPFAGLRYSPAKQVTLFAETNLDIYYSYERQETVQQDGFNTRSFANYNKWEFLLNPISFGIQFNIVSRD